MHFTHGEVPNQCSIVKDENLCANPLNQSEDVGSNKDCPAVIGQGSEALGDCIDTASVYSLKWLVQKQHFGVVNERTSQRRLLFHPVRKQAESLLCRVLEAQETEKFRGPRTDFSARYVI